MGLETLSLAEVAGFLDELLGAVTYREIRGRDGQADQNGIYLASNRPVSRITLALEPWPGLEESVSRGEADALFLHRPWRLTNSQRAVLVRHDVGVLSYHLAFDEHLTLGFNRLLAEGLGLESPVEILGFKEYRPIGMLGRLSVPIAAHRFVSFLRDFFGGMDSLNSVSDSAPEKLLSQVAVVGAMTDQLVREAHARGAGIYITGQKRQPAERAVLDTGISVATIGHLRSELWGLRALAEVIRRNLNLRASVVEPVPSPYKADLKGSGQ